MRTGKLKLTLAAVAGLAALVGTVALYMHPTVVLMLADQMWACFN